MVMQNCCDLGGVEGMGVRFSNAIYLRATRQELLELQILPDKGIFIGKFAPKVNDSSVLLRSALFRHYTSAEECVNQTVAYILRRFVVVPWEMKKA